MKKYEIAKNISKLMIKGLKVVRPNAGTSLPGHFMTKICPEFIKIESKKIKNETVCVTGTNGKTTTSGFIAAILNETGKPVLHNKQGANMPQGIATCFLQNGDNPIDYCVLECDEAWLYPLYKSLNANILTVTNLFPDQTERYGGVYALAKRIKQAIDLNPDLKVILNANDPHLLPLTTNNTVFYGIKEVINNIDELSYIPEICTCGEEYKYNKRFYAHIGEFECENCKNKTQKAKYQGIITLNDDYTEIEINDKYKFKTSLTGLYNAYNLMAAVSTALEIGISPEIIQKGLDNYKNVFGRIDKFKIDGKDVIIQLIKNPVGTNQAIKMIKDIKNSKLFVLLNNTPADGSDISWLYDTDFEYFKDYKNEVIFSGTKANELALRFKHAGLKERQFFIEPDVKKAYKHAIKATQKDETLLILANFTTLAELKNVMKR